MINNNTLGILNEIDNSSQINCKYYSSLIEYDSSGELSEGNSDGGPNFSVLHMNIRGYNKNFDEFLGWSGKDLFSFDVIILTEAWVEQCGVFQQLQGYDVYTTVEHRNRNDGIIIYVRQCFVTSVEFLKFDGATSLGINITNPQKNIVIVAICRNRDGDIERFADQICAHFRPHSNAQCLLIGDMNINLLDDTNGQVISYMACLEQSGFVSLIDCATRVQGDSRSCIDHIFFRKYVTSCMVGVIESSITDHFSTVITFKVEPGTLKEANDRDDIVRIDHEKLKIGFEKHDWDAICKESNVDDAAQLLVEGIQSCLSSASHASKLPSGRTKLTPWITGGIVKSIRTREKLAKQLKRQPFNTALKQRYVKYRNKLNIVIKKCKDEFFYKKFSELGSNARGTWKLLNNSILGKSRKNQTAALVTGRCMMNSMSELDAKKEVAGNFNDFLSNVGKNLAMRIPKHNARSHTPPDEIGSRAPFVFQSITELELWSIVKKMNGNSAPGPDGISHKIIVTYFEFIKRPIIHIINSSLEYSTFPDIFKLAKVIPLHKAGSKVELTNFRPISLLSVLSKLIEKWVKYQLNSYLEKHSLITNRQFGFTPGVGVEEAHYALTKDLYELMDRKSKGILVLIDLAKCFDSIDRGKLVGALERHGIVGRELSWFKCYLSHRKQLVSIEGVQSGTLPVDFGVIQGSTLGPDLFRIFINDISRVPIRGSLYLFADDAAFLFEQSSWQEVFSRANEDMNKVCQWLNSQSLTVNVDKSKYIQFSRARDKDSHPFNLYLHFCNLDQPSCTCEKIDRVNSGKYLGIVVDENLDWREQVKSVVNKIKKFTHIFYNIQNYFSKKTLIMLYKALVQSVLSFGILWWGNACGGVLEPLKVIQKTILKVLLKKPRRFPSAELFSEAKVFTLKQLYIKHALMFYHKHPEVLDAEQKPDRTRTVRLTTQAVIPIPLSRLRSTTRHFQHTLPFILRSIPYSLAHPHTVSRSAYKKALFSCLIAAGPLECEAMTTSIYSF